MEAFFSPHEQGAGGTHSGGELASPLVPKHALRLPGFDHKVLSLYARGMTVREIQAHLEELYQIEMRRR